MTTPTWIAEAITQYTGVTSPDDIAVIYDHMSDSVRSFGSLSPEAFRREALEAKGLAEYLRTPQGIAEVEALERQFGAL